MELYVCTENSSQFVYQGVNSGPVMIHFETHTYSSACSDQPGCEKCAPAGILAHTRR